MAEPGVKIGGEDGEMLLREPLGDPFDVVVEPPPLLDQNQPRITAGMFRAAEESGENRPVGRVLHHGGVQVVVGQNLGGHDPLLMIDEEA
ncbi:MAG: hypothetical protein MPW15_01715 [Candidatus Manganitrophus sp.]|nr:hypothetical protein [Candidatus Manganitrophus sp.]